MAALVPDFPEFDREWLEGIMRTALERPKARILGVSSQSVGAGQGFLSKVMRAMIEWAKEDADSGAPASVIIKVPVTSGMDGLSADMGAPQEKTKGADGQDVSNFDFVYEVHETECNFYDFCRAHSAPLKAPKAFFTQRHEKDKTGVIVMEDMGVDGMVPHMSYPLNRKQLDAVFKEVAKLHAFSLKNPAFFGVQLQQELKPEKLESFVSFVTGVCHTLKQQQPDVFGDLVDKTLPFVTLDNFMGSFTYFLTSGITPVMVHGDLWNNNFIFNRLKDSTDCPHGDDLLGILDFQVGPQ